MTRQNTILIVDGDGLLTRAHHAAGHNYFYKGLEIGGVYTSLKKIQWLIRAYNVDAFVAAFDPTEGEYEGHRTFRHALYAGYKANRQEKPPGLVASKPILMELLAKMGGSVVHAKGVEADDVVATAAKQASEQGWRAIVASGDKDMFVLAVDPNILIAPPFDSEPMTIAKIEEKFGVRGDQMTDYLALLGDSTDNIPGVDGCGAKRSADLLRKYGTLEMIVAAAQAGEIKNKLGEDLRRQAKNVVGFRDLIKLKMDVEDMPSLEDCGFKDPDYLFLIKRFEELGFIDFAKEARADFAQAGGEMPVEEAPVGKVVTTGTKEEDEDLSFF